MKSIVTLILALLIHLGCATYVYSDGSELDMDHSPLSELYVTSKAPVPKGFVNAGPNALKVFFRAFDNDFELDMKLHQHLFHADAPEHIQRHWSYMGTVTLNGWLHGHVSFTFERDDYHSNFHGSMMLDKAYYQIQHADKHDNFADSEHRMVLSRHGEGKDFDTVTPHDLIENPHRHASRRRLNLVYFDNCWAGQEQFVKALATGYTIDNSLQTKILEYMSNESGSNNEKVQRFVAQINTDSNVIYHTQVDVILSIIDIKMVGEAGTWQNSCPPDIGDYLDRLTDWRQSVSPTTGGMWKALTNCYPPPGTVGYAYVGTLCRGAATGVSNFMNIASGGTWGVNAHEAGHIFGARHSFENGQGQTGGIMDYGDGYYNDVFQFNPLRKNEVCGVLSNTIPQYDFCWSTIGQGDGATYNWRKNGQFSECTPSTGEYRWQSITYDCEVYVDGEKRQGTIAECDIADYPWGEVKTCDAVNTAAQCGNGVIEDGEECEASLDGTCCVNCAWSYEAQCAGTDSFIDAAFMADSGVLYVVSRSNVYRYSQGQENGLDSGYPKPIQEEWSGVTDEFVNSGIGGIVRKPAGSIMYMYLGRDSSAGTRNIKFLEINYGTGQLIQEGELTRDDLTDDNYGNDISFDNDVANRDTISYSNDFFRQCNGVDAGLSMPNGYYLFCESFFIEMDWNLDAITLRPVADLRIGLSWETKLRSYVTAAYYNWHDQAAMAKARIFNTNYFVDWWGFRTTGLESQAYPLTFQPIVVPPSNTGGGDSGGDSGTVDPGDVVASGTTTECDANAFCSICRTGAPTVCYACLEGYELFGSICLEKTTDINIEFGTTALDGDIQWIAGGIQTVIDLAFSGIIVDGAGIGGTAAASLTANDDGSTTRLMFSPIQKSFVKFELEAWFKPDANYAHANAGASAQFFTFTDGSSRRISVALESPDVGSNPHMRIDIEGAETLRCVTPAQIEVDQWTQFILKISAGSVDCCIQGTCIASAYEGVSEGALTFMLQDWYLGDIDGGIVGHVDNIKLKITEDLIPGVAKKTLVLAVVAILMFGILGVLGFKYRSDLLNPCGGDSHDRTVKSGAYASNNNTIQGSSSSWNKPAQTFSSQPPKPPVAPKAATGSRPPPPRPQVGTKLPPIGTKKHLQKTTSFRSKPPTAPTPVKPSGLPKRTFPKRGSNLPSANKSPPKRTFPPRRPPKKAPGSSGSNVSGSGPPPPPMKNLW